MEAVKGRRRGPRVKVVGAFYRSSLAPNRCSKNSLMCVKSDFLRTQESGQALGWGPVVRMRLRILRIRWCRSVGRATHVVAQALSHTSVRTDPARRSAAGTQPPFGRTSLIRSQRHTCRTRSTRAPEPTGHSRTWEKGHSVQMGGISRPVGPAGGGSE